MNAEEIEKFLTKNRPAESEYVQIKFKQRETIYGLFVKDTDYSYLKSKNFWRIVPQGKLEAYRASKDANLARIFNGAEISKLMSYKESFE